MNNTTIHKLKFLILACVLLFGVFTGCGSRQEAETAQMESEEGEKRGEETKETQGTDKSDEKEDAFEFIEKMEMRDYDDTETIYEIYLPKEAEVTEGTAFYNQHGLYYYNNICNYDSTEELYDMFAISVEKRLEQYQGPEIDYADLKFSGILENGEDRYCIITGMGMGYDGTSFEVKSLHYMEIQPNGAGIDWTLETVPGETDREADRVLCEIETCYGISLDAIKVESPIEPSDENQDDYQVKEGHNILETVDGYHYLGLGTFSDYDEVVECPVLIPKARETNVHASNAYSFLHGVRVVADLNTLYGNSIIMTELKTEMELIYQSRFDDNQKIRNVWKSAMFSVPDFEDAMYCVISYEKKSAKSDEYFPRAEVLCFIPVDESFYLAVTIYLSEEQYDASTNTVICELENAYGLDLSAYYDKASDTENVEEQGEVQQQEEILTIAKLMGSETGQKNETLSDTIYWFNATYAALTYSNGWNWRLIGGIKLTEENIEIDKSLLASDWKIYDRESALEKAEWLKEEGHRKGYRDCMEELKELGLLELEEDDFHKEFLKSSLKKNAYRYVIAYNMYHAGQDEDDMAAWDLCRLNQLYAAFYICDYMTYEEAMDASLENSLILQKMYGSWDEMIDAYMLGYQFWQSDPNTTDDSPTRKRSQIYEMLRQSPDNPYLMDWDTTLQKSW